MMVPFDILIAVIAVFISVVGIAVPTVIAISGLVWFIMALNNKALLTKIESIEKSQDALTKKMDSVLNNYISHGTCEAIRRECPCKGDIEHLKERIS